MLRLTQLCFDRCGIFTENWFVKEMKEFACEALQDILFCLFCLSAHRIFSVNTKCANKWEKNPHVNWLEHKGKAIRMEKIMTAINRLSYFVENPSWIFCLSFQQKWRKKFVLLTENWELNTFYKKKTKVMTPRPSNSITHRPKINEWRNLLEREREEWRKKNCQCTVHSWASLIARWFVNLKQNVNENKKHMFLYSSGVADDYNFAKKKNNEPKLKNPHAVKWQKKEKWWTWRWQQERESESDKKSK